MVSKSVKYIDFDENLQTETLYFNLNEAEIIRLDLEFEGGFEKYIGRLNEDPAKYPLKIMDMFEKIMATSVGHKSEDGKHFIKDDDEAAQFKNSAAYSALFVEMLQDGDEGAAFFNALMSRNSPLTKTSTE